MNHADDQPIEDVEVVEDAEIVDEAEIVAEAELASDAELAEPLVMAYDTGHYADAAPMAVEQIPAGLGRAMGCAAALAGSVCMALGYGYTINHVPAPWVGLPIVLLGIYLFVFPRCGLMRRMHENMRNS